MLKHCQSLVTLLIVFLPVSALGLEGKGAELLFAEPPQRVVALNWTQAEILLSLGITPVGATSIQGYKTWQSNTPEMPDGVAELGQRSEPNLEQIAALNPDLILGYTWRHQRIYPELSRIAPTVLYSQYPSSESPENYFIRMQGIYRSVAAIFNKQNEAEARLRELKHQLAVAKKSIKRAGLGEQNIVVGKFVGMGLGLRVYGESSLAGALVNELGLVNGWSSTLPGRDFTHADLLKLIDINDSSLVIMGDLPGSNNAMMKSPVWQSLPAVQEGRVYFMPSMWVFGGPDTATRFVGTLVKQLVAKEYM